MSKVILGPDQNFNASSKARPVGPKETAVSLHLGDNMGPGLSSHSEPCLGGSVGLGPGGSAGPC